MTKLQEQNGILFIKVKATDEENATVVSIAPRGDIVLVVGPEEVRLRVRSLILEGASKAFASLWSQNRRESLDLADSDAITEVYLPEDDVVGMKFICALIHHRHEFMPEFLSMYGILGVAFMVDKYDFIDAMALPSGMLLASENQEADELMVFMVAAFLFQNGPAFRRITKSLILDYGGSYLAVSNKSVESVIGSHVICEHIVKKRLQRMTHL